MKIGLKLYEIILSVLFLFLFQLMPLEAQTSISGTINDYAAVLEVFGKEEAKSDSVKVDNITPFSAGDIALIIQMKGAGLDTLDLQKIENINNFS